MNNTSYWSTQSQALWAKTGSDDGEWLSLPQHMMDSAATGEYLWKYWVSPGVKVDIEAQLGFIPEEAQVFVSWLCGSHDVGKASVIFAAQLDDQEKYVFLGDRIRGVGLPLRKNPHREQWYPHSTESRSAWAAYAKERFSLPVRYGNQVGDIFGAHHGLPASTAFATQSKIARQAAASQPWAQVQNELLDAIIEFTDAAPVLEKLSAGLAARSVQLSSDVKMLLTGVVIMADWFASNADLFPLGVYSPEENPERVRSAIESLNLTPPWAPRGFEEDTPSSAYSQSFQWPQGVMPRPMQEVAFEIAQSLEGPGLMCIEAPMGNGKTEAALLAAEVLAQKTGRSGIFFGAPTMATSDSLVARTKKWAENGGNNVTSMYLGHSKNTLNSAFGSMPRYSTMRVAPENIQGNRGSAQHTEVVAHHWLWGRKKGILSNVVVGTVDQLLMMALQSKHAMLRHLGLASKAIIIDEAHAYDFYTSSYMARTLEWLGAYGAPVILLSATLPPETKGELLQAYYRGLFGSATKELSVPDSGVAYPVITTVSRRGVEVVEVPPSATIQAFTTELIEDDEGTLRSLLQRTDEDGGCVLVLCNTVDRAQQAYQLAQEIVGDDAELLHARFTAVERVEKEKQLVTELGPDSTRGAGRPHRRIVVATQVVEQSLDVDFDCMITDVAPVDLLLQRMGRVHRHERGAGERPAWAAEPRVYVRGMDTLGSEEKAPEFSRGVDTVYHPSLLLATCTELQLFAGQEPLPITLPTDIPGLVRSVYSSPRVLPGWEVEFEEAQQDLENIKHCARLRAGTYQFPSPVNNVYRFGPFSDLWAGNQQDVSEEAGYAQVRDTDPTIEAVLVKAAGDGYYTPLPWLDEELAQNPLARGSMVDPEVARLLATCTVRLPYQFSKFPSIFEKALDELEQNTDSAWAQSLFLKGQVQLTLDENLRANLAGYDLQYSKDLGLVLLNPTYQRKEQA